MITADLSGDQSSPKHARREDVWYRLMAFTGQIDEQRADMLAVYRKDAGFLPLPSLKP